MSVLVILSIVKDFVTLSKHINFGKLLQSYVVCVRKECILGLFESESERDNLEDTVVVGRIILNYFKNGNGRDGLD
jgi:hypothetical protein